jgi:FtsH-binding integral membrane protein
MILQPVLGWLHHRNYVKYQRRTPVSHGHLWYGRLLMIIGIINGGIGLQLVSASTGLIAAYSVVGIIVFSLYVASAVRKEMALRKKSKGTEQLGTNSNSALELIP